MPRLITHLHVDGFRSLATADVPLGRLNVLIGANGSGKSNFLSLFRLLAAITESRLQLHVAREGGASTLLHYGPKRTPRMTLGLLFEGETESVSYSATLGYAPPDQLKFDNERLSHQHKTIRERDGVGPETMLTQETPADFVADDMRHVVLSHLERVRAHHFHDTSPGAAVKQASDLHDNRFLRGDAGNLAAFLYMLRETHRGHYDQVRDVVRLAFPSFDDFILEPSRLNESKILLNWRETGNDYQFGPHQLSDGTLRFICLATLLLQPMNHAGAPLTITIDEPELGLHPSAIVLLADLLRNAARQIQVIVSTQSAALLSSIGEVESVLVVERKQGASTIRRLERDAVEPWLDEYTLGDVWEKGVIGGRP